MWIDATNALLTSVTEEDFEEKLALADRSWNSVANLIGARFEAIRSADGAPDPGDSTIRSAAGPKTLVAFEHRVGTGSLEFEQRLDLALHATVVITRPPR